MVVRVDPVDVERASADLWVAGVEGIEEREVDGGEVELRGGLSAGRDPGPVAAAVAGGWAVAVEPVVGDEWLDAWQAHATAVDVGERLRVVPTWIAPPGDAPGRLDVLLPPHRAFGTGAHPTTRLALEELERRVVVGTSVLDVGSGSGLLCTAAALLGAAPVVALDVDPVALDATSATVAANGMTDGVDVAAVPVGELAGRFDVVVANIVLPTLAELVPAVAARVEPTGAVVLSGVLDEQVPQLLAACGGAGLDEVARHSLDGWALTVLARRPRA